MGNNEKKKQYDLEYAKKHLKRIPLDVKIDKYNEIKSHAENKGESVNGFVKRAIDETMLRDSIIGVKKIKGLKVVGRKRLPRVKIK